MSVLEKVITGKDSLPPRLLVYGTEGIGKSTYGSQASKPIFVQTEDGIGEIGCPRFPMAQSYDDVKGHLLALRSESHDFETVVVDSATRCERLIFDDICKEQGVSSIEKADGGYSKGYVTALGYWQQLTGLLNQLRTERNMAVIVIAHARVERFEDPEATAYDRWVPRLHKHAAALLCEWADAVLFATRKFRVQSEDVGFQRKRGIAHALGQSGGERVLRTTGGPSCIAKNRYGLPDEIPLSWSAFVAAMEAADSQMEGKSRG